ncbi:MAG: transglutaminase family protein [Verrucomicrobiota bacterium]
MSTHVALYHRTTYSYEKEIEIHPHIVRLKPAPHCRTPILAYSLSVAPEAHFINWQQDAFGNYLARLVFPEKTRKLEFVVDLVADLTTINPFDFFLEPDAEKVPFAYRDDERIELAPYLKQSERAKGLDELAADFNPEAAKGERTIDYLVNVNQAIQNLIRYNLRLEVGVQSCEETLEKGSGSCRDSAFLLVQLFRQLGFASRFVSGYLVQLQTDEKPLDGAAGPEKDFTDLHAWTEVFLPGAGWVGLDPTSGLFAGEGHIPLACTPEPSSAAPVLGSTEKAEAKFDFANEVTRVHEDPRVTKPYTTETWASIKSLGDVVDDLLKAGDVRLTMGGEPTFVSIDDFEGEEWHTAADSPAKRTRAIDLTHRLAEAFAPGGFVWFGEGKWYPGEPVPRWAYGIFWRKDGYPLWRSPAHQADPAQPGNYGAKEPGVLAEAITSILKISSDCLIPAFEDIEYYRWKASTLPHDEKVSESGEDDSLERQTLAALERRGLEVPVGYVLPMYHHADAERWVGAQWELKRGKLYLIPGASAMGFRLPLDSIRAATEKDIVKQRSPMEVGSPPLPADPLVSYQDPFPLDEWIPRTGLSVENREGRLHVFFPPTSTLEAYLELLAAVEEAARKTDLSVIIEGYEPPHDPRLECLKVTPDPGVIEVNIHPSASWDELVTRTETLYEAAKQARLGAEKFLIDGRHNGTGGGNHVVVGGATPADSPFLRRPDLLASLIAYWQHHPGLSYLFSSLFIGPTSQAPRVDEGRDDRVFELDIALETLHRGVEEPWLVDRTLRHLLTDLTGNTHRAEFCIDKLCSPDSSSGQLGLLELRAFEMPPHRHMSLVQSLLVRAIILRCWESPYRHELIRWGTSLHDRFLLPHWVWDDIREVCADLQRAGIEFRQSWLEPFFEFRFPRIGTVAHFGVDLELRSALEPWHVLGEESTGQGTARYVDSSVERLQLKVKGLTEGKHILTCNGRRVPLASTGKAQEWVGGVRFKAWDPPSAMHPSIKAQSRLTFDLIDLHNRKSLGGCAYHVSHPGGRSYDTFPVNAQEAAARRLSRFWAEGHTPGAMTTEPSPTRLPVAAPLKKTTFEPVPGGRTVESIPEEVRNREFPNTLDLRSSTTE